jgi:hypothetical protein
MPVLGEVWSFSGMEAVVVEVFDDGRVDLVGRTGRRVVLTERTMGHLWTCKRPVNPNDCDFCAHRTCENLGHVGDRFGKWFCGLHVPRNQPLLLPGDDPMLVGSFMRGMFVRCPVCKKKQETDPIQEFVEGFIVFTCNVCRAWWAVILGQGTPQDSELLVQDTTQAIDLFRRRDYKPFEGVCGAAAYSAIRRGPNVVTVMDRMLVIAGIQIHIDETYGSHTLALFGTPGFDVVGGVQHRPPKINVGDEYENLTTKILYKVKAVNTQNAVLQGEDGSTIDVWLADFWSVCRKVVRRSSYEILMSDDDLV